MAQRRPVADFLKSLGLGQYGQTFKDNMISIEDLPRMRAEDFEDLKVQRFHIPRILNAIQFEKQREQHRKSLVHFFKADRDLGKLFACFDSDGDGILRGKETDAFCDCLIWLLEKTANTGTAPVAQTPKARTGSVMFNSNSRTPRSTSKLSSPAEQAIRRDRLAEMYTMMEGQHPTAEFDAKDSVLNTLEMDQSAFESVCGAILQEIDHDLVGSYIEEEISRANPETSDPNIYKFLVNLGLLALEASGRHLKEAVSVLKVIVGGIMKDPVPATYASLSFENDMLKERLLRFNFSLPLLSALGYKMGQDCLIHQPNYDNTSMLKVAHKQLVDIENYLSHGKKGPQDALMGIQRRSYTIQHKLGSGCFGTVYMGREDDTDRVVAIKAIPQDPRYESRELQLMKLLDHTNIVALYHCFYRRDDEDPNKIYVNLVMEYVPICIADVCRAQKTSKKTNPLLLKLYSYQLCRALACCHEKGICHRDVKPQNLICDPVKGILKLCDFGSAKFLKKGEPNLSYIGSRFYRSPEQILESVLYTVVVDMWAAGCVMAELWLGAPLFQGSSNLEQMVHIIRVLGAPTKAEVRDMHVDAKYAVFPEVKPIHLTRLFMYYELDPGVEAINLMRETMRYDPAKRMGAFKALTAAYFDELRDPATKLPNGQPLPLLSNWTTAELKLATGLNLRERLGMDSLT